MGEFEMNENTKLYVVAPIIGAILVISYNLPFMQNDNVFPIFEFWVRNIIISFAIGYFVVALSNFFMSIFVSKRFKK